MDSITSSTLRPSASLSCSALPVNSTCRATTNRLIRVKTSMQSVRYAWPEFTAIPDLAFPFGKTETELTRTERELPAATTSFPPRAGRRRRPSMLEEVGRPQVATPWINYSRRDATTEDG